MMSKVTGKRVKALRAALEKTTDPVKRSGLRQQIASAGALTRIDDLRNERENLTKTENKAETGADHR